MAARKTTSTPSRRKRRGRPPDCAKPEVVERVVEAKKLGMSDIKACKLAGIGRSSFYEWQEKANEELARRAQDPPIVDELAQPYVDFIEKLHDAELQGEHELLSRIKQAGEPRRVRTITSKRQLVRDASGNVMLDADGQPLLAVVEQRVVESEEFDWKADLELLARRYHQEWGNRTRTELTGKGGAPIEHRQIPTQNVDAAALAELRAAMEEADLWEDETT